MRTNKLLINSIKTDMSYQSPVNSNEVKKIVKNFNPKALTSIIVSQRDSGEYYVIDGQHRMSALKQMQQPTIEALIYTGLTQNEEAEMYAKINERKTKSPNALGKAKYQSGDLVAIEIHDAVSNAGLIIDYDNTNTRMNHIKAYKALEVTHAKYGQEHLEETLVLLKKCFGDQSASFEGKLIYGMAKFLFHYRDDYKIKRLTTTVNRLGLPEFNRLYVQNKTIYNKVDKACAMTFVDIYNKKLNEDKRLNTMKVLI